MRHDLKKIKTRSLASSFS